MRYIRYFSTQALDEGFSPTVEPGREIFYRTPDWVRYKEFRGHDVGKLSSDQISRYDRHAGELKKLLQPSDKIISLGGGTGSLEERLADYLGTEITVSDIYPRTTCRNIKHINLDMTDISAANATLTNYDSVLISNALSPLMPNELVRLFESIGRSNATKVIIYSAEDFRLFNWLSYAVRILGRNLARRQAMWIGYLYGSKFIKTLMKRNGFDRVMHVMPNQHGMLTPLWGSVYLSIFARGEAATFSWNALDIDEDKMSM